MNENTVHDKINEPPKNIVTGNRDEVLNKIEDFNETLSSLHQVTNLLTQIIEELGAAKRNIIKNVNGVSNSLGIDLQKN
jgi:hypothetical protein